MLSTCCRQPLVILWQRPGYRIRCQGCGRQRSPGGSVPETCFLSWPAELAARWLAGKTRRGTPV